MRQNQAQNQKRSRGRGRRTGGYGQTNINRNTTFESNGPEGRLRGNAQQLYEKYTAQNKFFVTENVNKINDLVKEMVYYENLMLTKND
mgnify:CR=1 FL=1